MFPHREYDNKIFPKIIHTEIKTKTNTNINLFVPSQHSRRVGRMMPISILSIHLSQSLMCGED
jgi:hypothetical protein